jgi:predicted alpha-1,2-mannosidase
MNFRILTLFVLASAGASGVGIPPVPSNNRAPEVDLTKYVDPFIGTQGNGNTFPGASYPFGMVKLGPDTEGLNACMGYSPKGKIKGFSHTHVSGTGGGPKYGNILVYPFSGEVQVSGYSAGRGKETAKAGYFSMELTDSKVLAELTCTRKAGIHRYMFSQPGEMGILIDASTFLGGKWCCSENQQLVGAEVNILSDHEMSGYSRVRGGWNIGGAYTVYFYALFDAPAERWGTWKSGAKHEGSKSEYDSGEPVGAWFTYHNTGQKVVLVRVGVSFISIGKARENCLKEAAPLDFEQAVAKAEAAWNDYLQRMVVESADVAQKRTFYTALYHTLLMPAERTGENPLWLSPAPYYDDFYTIWDTFRTSNPLISLIAPEKASEIVNSLVDMYEHEGYMPDGRSGNFPGRTQGGSNSDMVIADAILKNLPGVNYENAFKAMIKNAEVPPGGDERQTGRGGLRDYNTIGYVSTDIERAGSRTVEYAANDWAIAQSALKLGKRAEYEKYHKRAANWENLWKTVDHSGATGFIMPRKAGGEWDENYRELIYQYFLDQAPHEFGVVPRDRIPERYFSKDVFTPLTEGSWQNFFYESHSWEYSLYVPQDVKQLMARSGGPGSFVSRLDTFFDKGYYNITNEPGFFSPCLYIYAGRQDKTAELVNRLLKKHFTDKPTGLPGNDDAGAMSSWYVFHSIGIFPNAGQDVFVITTPQFTKALVDIGNGKKLKITAENLSAENIYIVSAELNGRPLNQAWFRYGDIEQGAVLKFTMGSQPSGWGSAKPPPSRSDVPSSSTPAVEGR